MRNEVAKPRRKNSPHDYWCRTCHKGWEASECFPDESSGSVYESDDTVAREDDSGDIWIFKSPYFTYAQYCSPCAPGACYLMNELETPRDANRCYCLGHGWFGEADGHKAPYRVWSVASGREVLIKKEERDCQNCKGTGRDTLTRIMEVRGETDRDKVRKDLLAHDAQGIDDYRVSDDTLRCFRCNGFGKIEYYEESEV